MKVKLIIQVEVDDSRLPGLLKLLRDESGEISVSSDLSLTENRNDNVVVDGIGISDTEHFFRLREFEKGLSESQLKVWNLFLSRPGPWRAARIHGEEADARTRI